MLIFEIQGRTQRCCLGFSLSFIYLISSQPWIFSRFAVLFFMWHHDVPLRDVTRSDAVTYRCMTMWRVVPMKITNGVHHDQELTYDKWLIKQQTVQILCNCNALWCNFDEDVMWLFIFEYLFNNNSMRKLVRCLQYFKICWNEMHIYMSCYNCHII